MARARCDGSAACRRRSRRRAPRARGHARQRWDASWRAELFDHADPSFDLAGLPAAVDTRRLGRDAAHEVVPRRRGAARFGTADLRLRSIAGSSTCACRSASPRRCASTHFAAVSRYAWLAGDRRLAEIGIKSYPMRGSGTDFKQLADYRPGDAVRDIDWKATLRHGRAIVREYQDERDQSVMFMLDCGRRMRADEGVDVARGSHFDAALDALMLLSYVALKEGDEVGAMTFGGPPETIRRTRREGPALVQRLIAALHDVEPRETSDYPQRPPRWASRKSDRRSS